MLVDALGASVTAFSTYFLLAGKLLVTGLPIGILYSMAAIAACFVCFDLAAYIRRVDPAFPLRMIAILNISYSVFVMAAVFAYRIDVTHLGLAYFCTEIAMVLAVAVWEWTVARRPALP